MKELKGDDIHAYNINLQSKQFLYGWVEQKRIDVVVKIINPKGIKVKEIDSPTGDRGFENILIVLLLNFCTFLQENG